MRTEPLSSRIPRWRNAVAVAALAVIAAAPPVKRSSPGEYRGYSAERYPGWVRTTELVAVRDGTRLAVTVYRPARDGVATNERLPVLFSFTPYLARRLVDGKPGGVAEQPNHGARPFAELTRYGYVVAVADVRGKGSSFGSRSGYADAHEGEDCADLVEWLAARPYAAPAVGMFGCSYVGGTQWATARNVPPHLRAIFPEAGQFDSYRNVRRGGIAGQFNTRPQSTAEDLPTLPVDADRDGTLRRAALAEHEHNGQMSDLVAGLPFRGDRTATGVDYWSVSSPYPRIDAIRRAGIAVYAWGNWTDELADQAMLGYENTRGGTGLAKLVMGPGGHCDIDTMDSFAEHLRFYDHVLKGIDNGINREPPIWFKTIGLPANSAWHFADRLPLAPDAPTRFFLSTDGALLPVAPRSGVDRFVVRYDVGCAPPAWSIPRPQPGDPIPKPGDLPPPGLWPCVDARKAAAFSTAPMAAPMWLSGFPVVHLQLTATTRDAYVFGYLEDVGPDGTATLIGHGRLLASHRAMGSAPYRDFGLPWHTDARADAAPLVLGARTALTFELSPTSRIVAAGHRLRFSITGADQRQRDIARVRIDPTPVLAIALGGPQASRIDITLVPADRLAHLPSAATRND